MAWRDVTGLVGILAGVGLAVASAIETHAWLAGGLAVAVTGGAVSVWWRAKNRDVAVTPDRLLSLIIAFVVALASMAMAIDYR